MQFSVTELLQTAWLNRWNQRIELAMQGLAEVQTQAQWTELSADHLKIHQEDYDDYLEALLLKASLYRTQGQRQKSSALLAKALRHNDESNKPRSFRLLFELGLDYWIDQDLAKALEFFLLAERKAKVNIEKLFSLSNILWCLEALDLEREETESKVEVLLNELSQSNLDFVQHVEQLWKAYQIRQNFYQKLQKPKGNFTGQADFLQKWIEALPYVSNKKKTSLIQDYLWQGSYRLRTLACLWTPADQHGYRVSDAIDRLYLWTWLYMSGHKELSKEKILYTLDSVLKDFDLENQSKENLLLLRNSLGWILLLLPSLKSKIKNLQRQLIQISSSSYSVLEDEFNLICCLENKAYSKDFQGSFAIFQKIYKNTKAYLPVLAEALNSDKTKDYDLIVDQSKLEVVLPNENKLVQSKGLVKLFSLLMQEDEVSVSELEEYDVANLVYRARKLIGSKAIQFSQGSLSKGQDWPKAVLIAQDEIVYDTGVVAKQSIQESESYLQAAKALFPITFRRKELERKMKVSKATANRMIEEWIKEEKVFSTGKAKATLYQWKGNDL